MLFEDLEIKKPNLLDENEIFGIDQKIFIPRGLWQNIISSYSNEEIMKRMIVLIDEGKIKFPYREYNLEEIRNEFSLLQSKDASVQEGSWSCKRISEEIPTQYKERSLYVPQALRIGASVSDFFTQEERMEVGHERFRSPWSAWTSEKKSFLKFLLNPVMFNKDVTPKALKSALAMRSYIASQFKPQSAKVIYDFFDAKNVLDFSAGWGDRLVGFHASNAESYVGIDPNSKLHPKYEAISELCNTGKKTEFICSPAEDADLEDRVFDFVFTSPPYFTLERYSKEETQSWKRYPKMEKWLEGFLFPTLTKCWNHLSEGGRICVNIADAYTQGQREEICEPMLKHMEKLGATYEGVIGYEMGARPGKNMGDTSLMFCEPVWIWSKGEAPEPKFKIENFFGV
jgi:hypothetical protein